MSDPATVLGRSLGADVVESHAPVELDGAPIRVTLHPRDGDGLARALAALAETGLCAVPLGAGGHLGLGNAPARADAFLSTRQLDGVDVFEPAEGVCHAAAGTLLGTLRRRVAVDAWELPLDAPADATLGGALSAGVIGPRSHGFGPPKDAVLGLEVVNGSGVRTRCGGRVVKNVTGYDLAKLYTGALGSLGVIEGAWLRLRPAPECVRVIALALDGISEAACALALRTARLTSTRACALHGSRAEGFACTVELAGDRRAVEPDAASLAGSEAYPSAVDALATPATPGGGLGVRIAALPTELADVLAGLADAGARVVAHPGLRLVYGVFEEASAEALAAARDAASRASGPLRVESAPASVKRELDVFDTSPVEARLFAALKARLDPRSVLSPGRFAGCV